MVSIRYVAPAAALLVSSSSTLMASALSTPPTALRRTNRIHIACFVVPKAMESTVISKSKRKRKGNRKKRNQRQLGKGQRQQSSSYQSSSYSESHYKFSNEREDVDEWLIRSTALILGDNYYNTEDETQPEECSITTSDSSSESTIFSIRLHARIFIPCSICNEGLDSLEF
mmetsp:Transcript_11098/g.15901  ORF Transcript_11098/g.15901 Transcript_11098/m.15901 type:complete len:171 (+) Transcript_11098:141-653(+)